MQATTGRRGGISRITSALRKAAGAPAASEAGCPADPVLAPGKNVWRIDRASRAAVLIDGAAYFDALRATLMKARHSIFIVGWDIDSRCRLVGYDCKPDDGMPIDFAGFVAALAEKRPDLTIHLLLWDYPLIYALQRELSPTLSLHWGMPRGVKLCLDDELPAGSAHHQKVIVVDDAVAFCGGLDLTIRRWDRSEHALDDPDRVDPSGEPYRPFHDVQMMVDGDAARALGTLVRERWRHAGCDCASPAEEHADPWPEHVVPDFRDVDIGIARTVPLDDGGSETREVEALFLDTIAAARSTVYIENQFVTCTVVIERLIRTMKERPELEALIVAPQNYTSWFEQQAMRNGRIRAMRAIDDAGLSGRARVVYPEVREGDRSSDIMVHSKVTVIDDRILRIGSANLNNRSMGADTECDLVIEAQDEHQRKSIARIRDTLLGDHCGVAPEAIAESLRATGSLLGTAETISGRGHQLLPVDDGEPDDDEIAAAITGVADPPRPIGAAPGKGWLSRQGLSTLAKIAGALMVLLALPLLWHYTPLSALADPDRVRGLLTQVDANYASPLLVVGVFVAGGLIAFPVVVLIAVTAATFGPLEGLAYAAMGCLASALVTYFIGARLGKDMLNDLLGPRLDRIRRRVVDRGVLSVAVIRMVPVAPFTFVNLVAGASQIRLYDYVAGTLIGMAPGIVAMSLLGHQVFQIVSEPTAANIALLAGAVVAWIGISLGVQHLVTRYRSA